MQHRPKAVLLFFFVFTVIIRVPQLSRPLSKHHELNTAAVLICLQVWNDSGIAYAHGAPMHMFSGKTNTFSDPATPFPNLIRTGTYLSMGPGSYLLPWATFKLLHVSPRPMALRVFMLLLQLITLLLLYVLFGDVSKQLRKGPWDEQRSLLRIGLLFLTAPVVLWYMGNAYCHEVLALPIFVATLIVGGRVMEDGYRPQAKRYIGYGLLIAAGVYTDQLACVTALLFFVAAISIRQWKQRLPFLLLNTVAVLLPLGLIFWQYTSVIGVEEYKRFFLEQFLHRRTPDGGVTYNIIDYGKHFITGYGLAMVTAIIGFVILRGRMNKLLWLTILIPALHYAIFQGFSNEHDYSVLKWSPAIMLFSGAALSSLRSWWSIVDIMLTGIGLYVYINPPGTISLKGDRYDAMQHLGITVKQYAAADEYVFINTKGYHYQIAWYAQRNYKDVKDSADARLWLSHQSGTKALFIDVDEAMVPKRIVHINTSTSQAGQ